MILRFPELDALGWVEHGFGTRNSVDWPGSRPLAAVKQIHSDRVVVAEGPGVLGEGDALITDRPGFLLTIRTADCFPILLADREHRRVAAVHAGWRGTAAGIAAKTVAAMGSGDLVAVIGPGIQKCCFEVGPEVAVHFAGYPAERTHVDLAAENRRQLIEAGLSPDQIVVSDLCTCCGPDQFHSFRRDREASGRMVSAIGIRGLGQPARPPQI